jgi:hypothetical protein
MIGLFMLVLLLVAGGFIGYSVSNNTPISKNSINQCYIINKKLEYCVDAIYNVKYKINEIKEETSKMDVTNDLLNKYENQKTILEYQIIPRLKNIDTLQCGTQEGKNIEKQVDSLLNIVGL